MYTNLYGSSHIAAQYCALDNPPRRPIGIWQHGWISGGIEYPFQIFGAKIESLDTPCFVANNKIADCLKENGYGNVRAIGLPFVYINTPVCDRANESLLVFPSHLVPGAERETDHEESYAEYILSLKKDFKTISVWINAFDYDQGRWKDAFQKRGFDAKRGSDGLDCLQAQANYMSGFSHFTTDRMGSHIVYAASLGLKVCVAGPWHDISEDAIRNVVFYRENPQCVENVVKRNKKAWFVERFPFLFCEPKDANEHTAWAQSEIGFDKKITPGEMKARLGWGPEIWMANRIVPTGWFEHAPFAVWLVKNFKPRTLVELGTYHGYSYFVFCQAVHDFQTGSKCFCVDTWAGDPHAGFYPEDIYEKLNAHNEKHFASFSKVIRSTFDEASHQFEDRSVDLLHIDGFHSYEAVKHDFETWLPKMSENGVVLFHDINVHAREFGVWRFWDELKQKYPYYFEFLHCHGVGCLFLSMPEGLSMDETARKDVQLYFQSAGQILAQWENERQKNTQELHRMQARHDAMQAEVARMHGTAIWKLLFPFRAIERMREFGVEKILDALLLFISGHPGDKWSCEKYLRMHGEKMGEFWRGYPRLHYCLFKFDL